MTETGKLLRISYVSDLDLTPSGGGAYAVNWHAYDELSKRFETEYAGPVVPREQLLESGVSKVRRRVLGLPGNYSYFSEETLKRNAEDVARRVSPDSNAIVFRSAGRWARCRPSVPYFVYLDAAVHTFFHNTFDEKQFRTSDLERIWQAEAEFLEGASGVFFESEWGLRKARSAYNLEGGHYHVAGRGGVIEPLAGDMWDGQSHRLLTMAMSFRQKGGDIVADAYRLLKPRFPALEWHIVGGPPEDGVDSLPGVTWEGVLNPDWPTDHAKLTALLANAFLLVHPTREDTSPLVITEAAYFGCPAISMNMFAIPELVIDGTTGVLLEPPATANGVAAAIERLILETDSYLEMREDAREFAVANFQWSSIGEFICNEIDTVLAQ